MTNITHSCMICGHKMTKSEIIVFHGMNQCPNCFRDDFVIPVDSEEGEEGEDKND